MRRILAGLILSPVLLHAQAAKQIATLHPEARTDALKMAMPAIAGAVVPVTPMLRISTGVTGAKVIERAQIVFSSTELNPTENRIVVHLTVNESGQPQDAKVVSSQNPVLNERVLEAVRKYRFKPAQLDEQSVPAQVKLTFVFER